MSADGRYVYAGNRLHDSIAIFSVGSDGRLTFVGEEWTRGNYPRSFAFDPTGRFLYCCNQRADAITVFRVDRATGALSFTGHYAAGRQPVDHRLPRPRVDRRSFSRGGPHMMTARRASGWIPIHRAR